MRYASGEEAQVGDVVRYKDGGEHESGPVGSVHEDRVKYAITRGWDYIAGLELVRRAHDPRCTNPGLHTIGSECVIVSADEALPGWEPSLVHEWARIQRPDFALTALSDGRWEAWLRGAVDPESGTAPTLRDAMLAAEVAAGLRPETPCPPELQCGPLFGNFVCDKPKGHAGDHRGASVGVPVAPVVRPPAPVRDGTEWPARTEKPQAPTRSRRPRGLLALLGSDVPQGRAVRQVRAMSATKTCTHNTWYPWLRVNYLMQDDFFGDHEDSPKGKYRRQCQTLGCEGEEWAADLVPAPTEKK